MGVTANEANQQIENKKNDAKRLLAILTDSTKVSLLTMPSPVIESFILDRYE